MDTMLILTIIGIIVTIFFGWKSAYKIMHPKELADRHQKEIIAKGLCPECGSNKVDYEPEVDRDDDTGNPYYLGFDKGACKDCGYKWETKECHYNDKLQRIK